MQAITIMLGAAFLWSLYPLMIAYSDGRIGGALMVFIIHISCGVSAALFAFIKVRDRANSWKNIVAVTKTLQFEHWMYLMLIGLASTLYNFCFIYPFFISGRIPFNYSRHRALHLPHSYDFRSNLPLHLVQTTR